MALQSKRQKVLLEYFFPPQSLSLWLSSYHTDVFKCHTGSAFAFNTVCELSLLENVPETEMENPYPTIRSSSAHLM